MLLLERMDMTTLRITPFVFLLALWGCPGSESNLPGTRLDGGTDGNVSTDAGSGEMDAGTGGSDSGMGSDGGTDAGGTCKLECETDDCGAVPDGCGGFLTCSGCTDPEICGVLRSNKCDTPPPDTCTAMTAAEACPGKCGSVEDGCSGVIACNSSNGGLDCGADEVCGGYDGNLQPNTCVAQPTCTPQTCAELGIRCGPAGDGCGSVLDCTAETGGCPGSQVCGTGAESGQCVEPSCTPNVIEVACAGTCGIVDDGCGSQLDCEANATTQCPVGETCGGGGVPGECGATVGCTPTTEAAACAGKCGVVPDGCGDAYTCTGSNGGVDCDALGGESCGGGGVSNECGAPPCVPLTTAEACPNVGGFDTCGSQPDGCGEVIDCGSCGAGQQCGLDTANLCGDIPTCEPTPENTACSGRCGTVADGCGGSYDCDASTYGDTCSGTDFCGAVTPNECGTPPITCTPETCASLGHACGLASDGCGAIINCWPSCDEDDTSCAGACGTGGSCLTDTGTGAQACVTGGPSCTGSLCDDLPTGCDEASPTRLTGTVRTPGRVDGGTAVNRIPVPNAVVYIPGDPSVALPTVFQGVDSGNAASCGRCEDEELVVDGETILAAAVTDFRGDFTLEGRIPVGVPFSLVIKIGKWRRVVQIAAGVAEACATRSLSFEQTRLAANPTDGLAGTHLPLIAISTGRVDEMECVFRNIGIDEAEFTDPTDNGRIHMYRSNGSRLEEPTGCAGTFVFGGTTYDCDVNGNLTAGGVTRFSENVGCDASFTGCSWTNEPATPDSDLYESAATLNSYDLVVWDCEGEEEQHNAFDPNIEAYVDAGGRMFASHFSYAWIENNGSLDLSADWGAGGSANNGTGFISLPSGTTARVGANPVRSLLFRDWLDWEGALTGTAADMLDSPTTPQFAIEDPRDRAGANVGPATDEWVYRNAGGPRVQQLSFNTPYAADEDNICGRVAYSGFHVASANNFMAADTFPEICSDGELSAQEKVLVFMLFDLATCVSTGAGIDPPSCTPATASSLCPGANDACGFLSDGCGGVVDCGGCGTGFFCDGSTCRPQQCNPITCADLGFTCGDHSDGCGGVARNPQGVPGCGTCSDGQICGFSSPGICGGCVQIPEATACPSNSCGIVSNGCGGTYNCGGCDAGEVCGGGGANLCGPGSCTPTDQATSCTGLSCGVVSDGCGGSHDCGDCMAPETCGGGGVPNVCGQDLCTPIGQSTACSGLECGFVGDGCGGAYNCGFCPGGGVCGGAGPNLCGDSCTPTTCAAQNADCGVISDNCGGTLTCGQCPDGETCGAAGPNRCGGGVCTPADCASQAAECGLIGDGCGGVVDCGACTAPGETCGGDGAANQCGIGEGGCTPTSCAATGTECGQASNGCGGLLDCGNCNPGFTCRQGSCDPVLI